MIDKKTRHPGKETDPIDNLLRLPKKGLEERITRLQTEIANRENLTKQLMTDWYSKQARLEDRVNRLFYTSHLPTGFQSKKDAEAQILRIQEMRTRELVNSFRDLLDLKEKLEAALHELETEKQKLQLLDS